MGRTRESRLQSLNQKNEKACYSNLALPIKFRLNCRNYSGLLAACGGSPRDGVGAGCTARPHPIPGGAAAGSEESRRGKPLIVKNFLPLVPRYNKVKVKNLPKHTIFYTNTFT